MPRYRDVGQIHVAFVRVLILAKNRVESLRDLGGARFVNATPVSTQQYCSPSPAACFLQNSILLYIASLVLASAFHYVLESDFLAVCSPCMREYKILRDLVTLTFHQVQIPIAFTSYKTCCGQKAEQLQVSGHAANIWSQIVLTTRRIAVRILSLWRFES